MADGGAPQSRSDLFQAVAQAEARRLLSLAADQGRADAQYGLGMMHREGEGGPQDGAYFATHAAYPVNIYPRRANPSGTYDLIVAEVACGSVCDLGDRVDGSLKRAPARTEVLLHHSVRGTEQGIGARLSTSHAHGEQFVVYDHHRAYPHFLLTISKSGASRRVYTATIVNVHSGRQLYAAKDYGGEEKVGADQPAEIGEDGKWTITELVDGAATIINVHSGRQLYAAKGHDWEEKVGADQPAEIGEDGKWLLHRV